MSVKEKVTFPNLTPLSGSDPYVRGCNSFEYVLACGHSVMNLRPDWARDSNCCTVVHSSGNSMKKLAAGVAFWCDAWIEETERRGRDRGNSSLNTGTLNEETGSFSWIPERPHRLPKAALQAIVEKETEVENEEEEEDVSAPIEPSGPPRSKRVINAAVSRKPSRRRSSICSTKTVGLVNAELRARRGCRLVQTVSWQLG
jgi:hypothetical protein